MIWYNNFSRWFGSKANLQSINFLGNFKKIKSNAFWCFANSCPNLKSFYIKNIDLSYADNISFLISSSKNISFEDFQQWNLSNVKELNSIMDWLNINKLYVSSWQLKNATSIKDCFECCNYLQIIKGLQYWDTSTINDFSGVFRGCLNLFLIDNISNWNTSSGKTFDDMFGSFFASTHSGCQSLTSLNLSKWNMSNAQSISRMFGACYNLQTLTGLESWKLNNIKSMEQLFSECRSLLNINSLIENWDWTNITPKINSVSEFFQGCHQLNNIAFLNKWNTYNLKYLDSFCASCYNLTNVNSISNWNTLNVIWMNNMFSICRNLTEINLSKWQTNNVGFFDRTFYGCQNLISINISPWNTYKANNFSNMFSDCEKLTTLDINNWNTLNGKDFSQMFSHCRNLTTLKIDNWNTVNGKDFSYMFWNCQNLITLNINNWNISNGNNFVAMFSNCKNLQSLNLAEWNFEKCTTAASMFANCNNLKTIYFNNCNFQNSPILTYAFNNIPNNCNIWVKDSFTKNLFLASRSTLTNIKIAANLGWDLSSSTSYTIMNTVTSTKDIGYYGAYVEDHPNDFSVSVSPTSTTQFNASATIDKTNYKITLTITGKAEGTNNITLTLQDTQGHSISQQIPITIAPHIPQHYEVQDLSTTYTFVENSNGYYESNNQGIDNSFAICKLVFVSGTGNLILDCINYAESSYDFGMLSNIDTTLNLDANADTTNVYKSFKGLSQSGVQTITYSNLDSNEHFIYIKYRKDTSVANNNDSLQFKVRFD